MAEIQVSKVAEKWARPYTPGLLTEQELEQFFSEGYVIKHGVCSEEDLKPAISDIEFLVDELANTLLAAGKIKDTFKDIGFYKRLCKLNEQFPNCTVLLHKRDILPPSFGDFFTHPKLLSIAKQVLGPEVSAHPVWNLRPKIPNQEVAEVPWHQDVAYMSKDCWKSLQLAAWIPFIDVTKENGCMQVLPRAHRPGRVFTHTGCPGDTWQLEIPSDILMKEMGVDYKNQIATCEMPMGSVLIFNAILPHRSFTNTSEELRWSLDIRWNDSRQPTGFYGLKGSLPLSSGGQDLKVDWSKWAKMSRTDLQMKTCRGVESAEDEFNATVPGPWMKNWEITHHNRHTASLK